MKKKRVAFVINGLYGGGAERVLQVFLNNYDRRKYDITVVSHKQEDIHAPYPAGIRYKSILKSKSGLGNMWVRIYNKINLTIYEKFPPRIFRLFYLREKFDVEIAFIEGYATRIVSGGRSDRKIAWVHIDLKLYPWTDIAFRSKEEQAECYSKFDEVVSVSESVRRSVEELFPCRSVVIYNPIDTKTIRETSSESAVEKEPGPLLFVSAGRLAPQKGYDRLITIAGQLVSEGFDFRLWIVGEGSERELLEGLIRSWKLEGTVKLLGYQPNPYPYMKAADWFVLSSRHEGYGLVVAEALILGTPVISVMCGEMDHMLGRNNEWGIIVDNEDAALLDGMRNILANKELTEEYGKRAAEGGNRFSLERQMEEIYGVIETDRV
mgnify:CR=1 FL=1